MPYQSIKEAKDAGFPTSAEDIDLTLGQINHLSRIYDAIKKTGTAEAAFAVAWTAWKKAYKKEGDKWVRVVKAEQLKQLAVITNAEIISIESHDAILQTLERWMPGYNQGKGDEGYVYFSKEPFEKAIDDWNGTDLVFGAEHPNMKLFASNPEEALKAVDARIIGKLSKAQIETAGHPRLMGTLKIEDEEASKLYDAGKLSLSTGFFVPINKEYRITGRTIPNHILLFEEDENAQPKDRGAFILNMTEIENEGKVLSAKNETEFKAIMDKLRGFFKNLTTVNKKKEVENQERNNLEEKEMDEKEKTELTSKLEAANAELVNRTSEFETATKAHEDEVKGYKDRIAEFEQKEADKTKAERDTQFEQIVAKLPPGMTHKEEDKTALRAKFDSNPTALMVELMAMERREGTGEEGDEFGTDPDEIAKAAKEIETEAAMEVPG